MTILITGDTHGKHDIQKLIDLDARKILTEKDIVIIAGDFALLKNPVPDSTIYQRNEELLSIYNNFAWTTLFIDGNHENFDLLRTLPIEQNNSKYKNMGRIIDNKLYHLRRGYIYTIDNIKILTIGGATSIDRWARELIQTDNNKLWWEEENISKEDRRIVCKSLVDNGFSNKIDYVITHCLPSSILPLVYIGSGIEKYDYNNIFLEEVREQIEFKHWYCGHYHKDLKLNDKFTCTYNEFYELK